MKYLAILVAAFALTACEGGGTDSGGVTANPVKIETDQSSGDKAVPAPAPAPVVVEPVVVTPAPAPAPAPEPTAEPIRRLSQ